MSTPRRPTPHPRRESATGISPSLNFHPSLLGFYRTDAGYAITLCRRILQGLPVGVEEARNALVSALPAIRLFVAESRRFEDLKINSGIRAFAEVLSELVRCAQDPQGAVIGFDYRFFPNIAFSRVFRLADNFPLPGTDEDPPSNSDLNKVPSLFESCYNSPIPAGPNVNFTQPVEFDKLVHRIMLAEAPSAVVESDGEEDDDESDEENSGSESDHASHAPLPLAQYGAHRRKRGPTSRSQVGTTDSEDEHIPEGPLKKPKIDALDTASSKPSKPAPASIPVTSAPVASGSKPSETKVPRSSHKPKGPRIPFANLTDAELAAIMARHAAELRDAYEKRSKAKGRYKSVLHLDGGNVNAIMSVSLLGTSPVEFRPTLGNTDRSRHLAADEIDLAPTVKIVEDEIRRLPVDHIEAINMPLSSCINCVLACIECIPNGIGTGCQGCRAAKLRTCDHKISAEHLHRLVQEIIPITERHDSTLNAALDDLSSSLEHTGQIFQLYRSSVEDLRLRFTRFRVILKRIAEVDGWSHVRQRFSNLPPDDVETAVIHFVDKLEAQFGVSLGLIDNGPESDLAPPLVDSAMPGVAKMPAADPIPDRMEVDVADRIPTSSKGKGRDKGLIPLDPSFSPHIGSVMVGTVSPKDLILPSSFSLTNLPLNVAKDPTSDPLGDLIDAMMPTGPKEAIAAEDEFLRSVLVSDPAPVDVAMATSGPSRPRTSDRIPPGNVENPSAEKKKKKDGASAAAAPRKPKPKPKAKPKRNVRAG
uniref:Uncharacterized protein n=1 Tax=Mycena chlorophos TaxID=658473 RepID=A0ABQ0L286_MYCCL|nr:predicted protein [Mycena chlorophos]